MTPASEDAGKGHGAEKPKPAVIGLAPGSGQTQLDGSFTITGVAPGDYYVRAEMAGYLSPALEFTARDWSHPTDETLHRMAQTLVPVTVTANNSSRVDVSMVKGGSISGTVRCEDGMPMFNSQMTLLRHDPKGTANDYYPLETSSGAIRTDDQGGLARPDLFDESLGDRVLVHPKYPVTIG